MNSRNELKMLMEGKFTIKEPIQKLWGTLLDPETLLSCTPGAEKIERIDEKTFDCVGKEMAAVSFCATLKAADINILRPIAFKNSKDEENLVRDQRNLGL